MRKMSLSLILFLLTWSSALAGPIPDLFETPFDSEIFPPIDLEIPTEPEDIGMPAPEITPELPQSNISQKISLDAVQNASGVLYYSVLSAWGQDPKPKKKVQLQTETATLAAASAVVGTVQATNDSNQDIEPSVISINKNGIVYTITAYTKYLPGVIPRNYFSTTTNFSVFSGGILSLPTGFTQSGDPLLAVNPFADGVAPGRVYLTGLLMNDNGYPPTGIAVWHSDDGGLTWSSPTIVAQSNDPNAPVDKPAIIVSWHSSSRGVVYVAYVKTDPNTGNKQILVSKSTDGGQTFWLSRQVTSGNIHGPQILVNPYYGNIYVLWTDFSMDAIRMSSSSNYYLTWSAPETAATGSMMLGNINGGVKAGSLSMARVNHLANKICVVWHEREQPGSSRTDVYYAAKSSAGWQTKVMINDTQTNDQFMPALDYDNTGNLMVTFYDRRRDPNNLLYDLYMARINSSGVRLQANALVSPFQSNPQSYTDRSSFIGDYQDIWSQAISSVEYYLPSWVGIPTTTGIGNIYISAIQP